MSGTTAQRILVHKALYGEKNRGHALLASSLPAESLPAGLAELTDLPPSQLPSGIALGTYLCGRRLGPFYALCQIQPDLLASRTGMVRSRVLLVPSEDAGKLADLGVLLDIMSSWDDASEMPSCSLDLPVPVQSVFARVPGLSAVAHRLLDQAGPPVVLLGQDGFMEIVSSLWANLWPAARREFSFGMAFAPEDAKNVTFVWTPADLKARWQDHCLVSLHPPAGPVRPATLAESLLTGASEAAPLRDVLAEIGDIPAPLTSLTRLERCLEYREKARIGVNFSERLRFLRQVGELAPDPVQAIGLKQEAMSRLATYRSFGALEVGALANLDFSPFPDSWQWMNQMIGKWSGDGLLDAQPNEVATLLDRAYGTLAKPEWREAVQDAARAALQSATFPAAFMSWQWWQQSLELAQHTLPLVPLTPTAEQAWLDTCPNSLSTDLGDIVLAAAKERGWLRLHGTVLSASKMPQAAYREHLSALTDPIHTIGLPEMAQRFEPDQTLQAALEIDDPRMVHLAGTECAKHPRLLSALDPLQQIWRRVWLETARHRGELWQGLADPASITGKLLDQILDGVDVDLDLLERIALTPQGNLVSYPGRSALWPKLPTSIRNMFLTQTAAAWLSAALGQADWSLEPLLLEKILDEAGLEDAVRQAGDRALSLALELCEHFPQISERQFINWLRQHSLSAQRVVPVTRIGTLIQARNWRASAATLYDLMLRGEQNLRPAVIECIGLLNVFKRIRMSMTTAPVQSAPTLYLTEDELWEALLEAVTSVFSRGPDHEHLWEEAGGDPAQLEYHGNGQQRWQSALLLLRHGGCGDITSDTLIKAMARLRPQNPDILLLRHFVEKSE